MLQPNLTHPTATISFCYPHLVELKVSSATAACETKQGDAFIMQFLEQFCWDKAQSGSGERS